MFDVFALCLPCVRDAVFGTAFGVFLSRRSVHVFGAMLRVSNHGARGPRFFNEANGARQIFPKPDHGFNREQTGPS